MAQPDLKNIADEIRTLANKIDRLEKIIQTKLIAEVVPDEYEKKIAEFEKKKKEGKLEFSPLS